MATPMPLAVVICPSVTTPALVYSFAPSSLSSKPGNTVASLPFKNPSSPNIYGAAQIAAILFPDWLYFISALVNFSLAAKLGVPGTPPGKNSISASSISVSSIVWSAIITIPWTPVTLVVSLIDTVLTWISPLNNTSITAIASVSSNPSAKNAYTLLIKTSFLSICFNRSIHH